MAFKHFLFVSLVLVIGLTAPLAAEALVIRITGTVLCSLNGTTGAPAFPNALVNLECGSGNVVASGRTNSTGVVRILLDSTAIPLSTVLNNCTLVLSTPLSNCNATLPNVVGSLSSRLQVFGDIIPQLLQIITIAGSLALPPLN